MFDLLRISPCPSTGVRWPQILWATQSWPNRLPNVTMLWPSHGDLHPHWVVSTRLSRHIDWCSTLDIGMCIWYPYCMIATLNCFVQLFSITSHCYQLIPANSCFTITQYPICSCCLASPRNSTNCVLQCCDTCYFSLPYKHSKLRYIHVYTSHVYTYRYVYVHNYTYIVSFSGHRGTTFGHVNWPRQWSLDVTLYPWHRTHSVEWNHPWVYQRLSPVWMASFSGLW